MVFISLHFTFSAEYELGTSENMESKSSTLFVTVSGHKAVPSIERKLLQRNGNKYFYRQISVWPAVFSRAEIWAPDVTSG
jgi:hypothetical protein